MTIWHLVANTARGDVDLTDWGLAVRVWRALRGTFPRALAAGLMPDHLHVIDESMGEREARRALGRALSRATYGLGRGVWQAVPPPDRVREPKLERAIRYVVLNPCRGGLVPDPLEWMWSTHRDVMGAVADPWVDAARLATRLGPRRWRSREAWHRYVSSDFSVAPTGTPAPEALSAGGGRGASLTAVAVAAAAAFRAPSTAIRDRGEVRRLFLHVAHNVGWHDTALLARTVGTSRRSVARILQYPRDRAAWRAALICLGDPRLRPNHLGKKVSCGDV